ncbi:MAG: cytochrome c [Bacteroidota bacterium]
MKNLIRFIIISVVLSFTLSGCYYDKEDLIYPACDVSNVTYKATIAPILKTNCDGCHYTGSTTGNGIVTDNYNDLSGMATADGMLWTAINGIGVSPMPKNTSKLSDCDIARIKKWIDGGALNN